MNITRKDIKILAPAGSFESLQAAIQGGADAVYFGIEKLNMRSRSSYNFSRNDLPEIVTIAQRHGIETYLTLNTVVYDQEFELIKEIVDLAVELGVDAVIASDQSVIQYASGRGLKVHISTQLNVSNTETLKFYAAYADVVVLARELDLKQVSSISQRIIKEDIRGPNGSLVKIEIFVHGALCMAISGKCYLSLHEYNHSANRGDCLQACRRAYIARDKESGHELEIDNEFILSPKDLCTIHFLNKIMDSGVTLLKIEGRARSPEYVKTVTQCYNEAVQSVIEGSYGKEKIRAWMERLSSVFNRGFWDGYYLGQKLGEWSHIYGSRATKKKIYTAKASNYFDKIKVGEFFVESGELNLGDEILITGPTTGVVECVVQEIHVDRKPVTKAIRGEIFSIPVPELIRRSDRLYRLVSSSPK